MNYFEQVYKVVKKIPKGKVATYGQVAFIMQRSKFKNQNASLETKISARVVGWALHGNKNPKIPCHRVVNKKGSVAVNYAFGGGWREQKKRLINEGITFVSEKQVDLEKHLWKGLAN